MANPRLARLACRLVILGIVACLATPSTALSCNKLFGSKPITFLMVADPGDYTGTGENRYLLDALSNAKTYADFAPFCTGVMHVGKLFGQTTAVVTSGIGPLQATSCMQKLLSECPKSIKEIMMLGTSGFPATVGGMLNPPACNTSSPNNKKGQVIRVGDVCVTTFGANWDCRLEEWGAQAGGYPNLCFRPFDFAGPTVESLYGKCLFYSAPKEALDLANEIVAAAKSLKGRNAQPLRNNYTQAFESAYWAAQNQGDIKYATYEVSDPVNVFGPTECAEVDSQFFFSGVPWEVSTRDYVAATLNLAYNVTNYNASNVVYTNAMEGIGYLQALEIYHALPSTKKKIPYAIVRGASNYSHQPVAYRGNGTWTYAADIPGDFVNNYAMAIASNSNAVLATLSARCSKAGKPASTCGYKIRV